MAARMVREGRPDEAIALLKNSMAFPGTSQRAEAVAGMLFQLGRTTELGEYLNQLPESDRLTPSLLVIDATWASSEEVQDFARADRDLDLAFEMSKDNIGVLRRIAMLRVSNKGLRDFDSETKTGGRYEIMSRKQRIC